VIVQTRCAEGVACADVVRRLEQADRLDAYGLDSGPLRARARDISRRCLEAEEGRRTGWGLGA
jgi:hypothetical protein